MKICELIEWLKRENPLSEVEIEIKDRDYPYITTFQSGIQYIQYLGKDLDTVRIIGNQYGKVILQDSISQTEETGYSKWKRENT